MFDTPLFTIAIIILGFVGVYFYCYQTGEVIDKYKKNGIRVEARILSKEKIGASGTGNTKFRVVVEFPTKSSVVTATTKRYFTPEELIKVMRENTVIIYYLPDEPTKILLAPDEME